ncbi:anaphase promoting complex subunit CDC16 [Saccharomyces eubayanus]|uniref:anaphase promoting complex subunit CDC16 n=1 Tax=Saccharomyces eubayanus TaxID=1080349 RepID=UPI0006C3F2DA|nr:CDC16-like protein [Saccharomyces eubayanus]KOG98295.1 CDC16-like protein [Saccharomyces eubayanus]
MRISYSRQVCHSGAKSLKTPAMRNPMSPTEQHSQHNSTLAASPFVSNVSAARTQQNLANDTQNDHSQPWNRTNTTTSPYQSLANSPLIQKLQANIMTPHQPSINSGSAAGNNANDNNLLASMSKNSMFGSTIPSTLRKVSLQREYKDSIDGTLDDGDDNNGNTTVNTNNDRESKLENNGPLTTTTLTTTTTATQLDVSELSAIERLRLWRFDALMQHMYRTAEYIADKVYTISNDPDDAFWLGQVYYNNNQYVRAVELITRNNLDSINILCRYLLGLSFVKLQKYDDALDVIGEYNPFSEDPTFAAANVTSNNGTNSSTSQPTDGGIKMESSLCFLRGKIYFAQNNFNKAKEAFREAILVDIKNFEAFEMLLSKNLLTPQEEWDLFHSLDFKEFGEDREIMKNLYKINLSKYINTDEITRSNEILTEEYKLGDNVDVIRSRVDILYTQCKFNECLELCEAVLENDEFNTNILPTYIGCLYELSNKNKLFLLSHRLAENFPKSAITWFSVATYYMSLDRISEAQKYYSKSSILDPSFAAAWLGFAHTYALEGEQDQALTAYSTASRFFPGMHLPKLFLGMQFMAMNSLNLAESYFVLAYDICPNDPLVLNEMGVMYFKKNEFVKAKKYLKKALEVVKDLDPGSRTTISIQLNLGHTYRKLNENEIAIKCFKCVLEKNDKNSEIHCSLGYLYLKTKKLQKAIDHLHKSLYLKPNNVSATTLLKNALELNVTLSLDSSHPLLDKSNLMDQANKNKTLVNKKRSSLAYDPVNMAKRLRTQKELFDQNNEFLKAGVHDSKNGSNDNGDDDFDADMELE